MSLKYRDKKNKSNAFILPLIEGVPKIYFGDVVNCYVNAEFAKDTAGTGIVYVAFLTDAIIGQYYNIAGSNRALINKTRVDALNIHPDLVDIITVEMFTVYSFQLRDEYLDDLSKFLGGQYSKMSTKAKGKILQFYPGVTKLKDILYPSTEAKEAFSKEYGLDMNLKEIKELSSIPNWELETFKLSNFLIIEE